MANDEFWQSRRVCVTGGAGFLGRVVVRKLRERGVKEVFIPNIEDYDLVKLNDINRMLKDASANIIIHLAAQVGGIGANLDDLQLPCSHHQKRKISMLHEYPICDLQL